ncbi:Tryptophan synthase beta subunit-like PLP-dependent enzyme [Glarea lozoyensis ATCC 20868]|uniref:Tryptophan synthase beta subunit-like PLP-dependent enzyme n=1 Tax=Glarea lozoyensis (strain ATCC 20868 / MF5171) TaxID=1116229 RepID=S3D8T8_GLAL2|nr:Tryptophan synthase beta subunit-like PLP-dependent enzyme [Glarea lozoyensis ATCC 20868]EPE34872.1 Tryptophan synthase beta subunit-like PLP-dependent enzyme [Glarea lozoyensis ATCC 20868]
MANPAHCPPLTRASVLEAHERIKPYIHHTPVLTNTYLDELASTPQSPEALVGTEWEGQEPARPKIRFYFKCENFQRVGAFKVRGAFHAVGRLMGEWDGEGEGMGEDEGDGVEGGKGKGVEGGKRVRAVVTHSSGNHAQALALAARTMGIPAHIVMPTISTPSKIAATRSYGATLYFSGSTSTEREAMVAEVVKETGARLVPPYDHPDIVLGQGTMGVELQEQAREIMGGRKGMGSNGDGKKGETTGLDAIITPCGGGGMLSGTALSCEGTGIRVFGAEPTFEGADDGRRGFYSGTRVESVKSKTIADGLRTPLGKIPWSIIYERGLVKGMYGVSEGQIKKAMRLVVERMKVVVEPSAVVGLATALWDEGFRRMVQDEGGNGGWDVGIVFSGGNVGVEALGGLLAGDEGEGKGGLEREMGKVGLDGGGRLRMLLVELVTKVYILSNKSRYRKRLNKTSFRIRTVG